MSRPSILLASLALGLLGCQPDPSIGLTAGAETTTTGDPTASETTTTTDDTTTDPTTTTGEPTTSTTSTTEEPTTTTGDPPCNENLVCNTHEDLASCLHDCGICEVDGICDPETETPHSCPEDCPATACNLDGVINALSEQCDDGEETATCNADCSLAQCGDGHLNQTAGEECDDGNLVDGDGCSSTCTIEERLVFVTSAQFAGDLNPGEAGISGLELADHHCQGLADTAGHPGIFMAWLSDNDIGPATHFELPADFVARFVRTDGEVIADGWEDLTDGELKTEITRDEYGIEVTALVWSNTTAEGEPAELGSCHNWTSKSAFVSGGVGVAEDGIDDANWTQFDDAFCATAARLYCFQVG